jgi:hypothetical protein
VVTKLTLPRPLEKGFLLLETGAGGGDIIVILIFQKTIVGLGLENVAGAIYYLTRSTAATVFLLTGDMEFISTKIIHCIPT